MNLKKVLVRLHWVFSMQFGVDPRKFLRSIRGLPRYVGDLMRFRYGYSGRLQLLPCLHDWYEEGGSTTNEYFWQDLLVAKMISVAKPKKHIDIGSRVDGFVAHVACFREIEVFDVRPITTKIPGMTFRQADFMNPVEGMTDYCDSLSCLHALEHFGLGRYGDPINPEGPECGFANMASLLKKDGLFYLSVPIGIERVEFNANRVFDPRVIIKMAEKNSFQLSSLIVIQQGGESRKVIPTEADLSDLANQNYSLGIFTFQK
jgi:SAM-dependent methyltransferase